jgi:hypothetical protein
MLPLLLLRRKQLLQNLTSRLCLEVSEVAKMLLQQRLLQQRKRTIRMLKKIYLPSY